ncbi:MAG: hypothetical protein COY40_06415 [Alphaproteobacteria bacterium CG_4_10_14_0_8_um_filter_53_9]|nr:MAG: hypothetical protein COY40_06415 [Alphaproteobacteria bacterium CG_4_10_14_0_8_um_filter_53_9]
MVNIVDQNGGAKKASSDAGHEAATKALAALLGTDDAEKAPPYGEGKTWRVPDLAHGFSVDDAVRTAMQRAATYLNHRMQGEGVVVALQQNDAQTAAVLKENGSERILREYKQTDIMRLYAAQVMAGRGLVVDGAV